MKTYYALVGTFALSVGIAVVLPSYLLAENQICSPTGYSVVYVNGIFTDKNKAEEDKRVLFRIF